MIDKFKSRWAKLSKAYRQANPYCQLCFKKGLMVKATDCDHIVEHFNNKALIFDISNLQSLCKECHIEKTARERSDLTRKFKKQNNRSLY